MEVDGTGRRPTAQSRVVQRHSQTAFLFGDVPMRATLAAALVRYQPPQLALWPFLCHILCFRSPFCPTGAAIPNDSMQIWPAIDLRGGKYVQLRQGDYQQGRLRTGPGGVARQFADGARTCTSSTWKAREACRSFAERAIDSGGDGHRV
jgi:hypothetical protein